MNRGVYVQASFDVLHRGHIRLLERCRKLGGPLVVSLISDESYEAYRGYPPALSWRDRYAVVSNLKLVDVVFRGDHRKTRSELERERPQFVVLGTDWVHKDIEAHWGITQGWLDERGIILLYLPYTTGISSTAIKERIVAHGSAQSAPAGHACIHAQT